MAPLIALFLGTLAARLVGWLGVDYVDGWPGAVAAGLALMFVITGIAHFVNPLRRDLIAIVPAQLPESGLSVIQRVTQRSINKCRTGLAEKQP